MSKYDFDLDTNINSSTGRIISRVSKGSTVLEFGCAAGRMTRYFKEELGCSVYIVEYCKEDYDKAIKYAVDGYCGDIMQYEWLTKFKDIKFDYIIFADVLEHLRDPESVLRATNDVLKDDGAVLCSIPNVGHADILLNLYENKFHYSTVGLLDDTHIHLFAYRELEPFVSKCGYSIVKEDATYFTEYTSESAKLLDDKSHALYDQILARRSLSNVYQFVLELKKTDYVERFYITKESSLNLAPKDSECTISYGEDHSYSLSVYPDKVVDDTFTYNINLSNEPSTSVMIKPMVKGASIMYNFMVSCNDELADIECLNGKTVQGYTFFAGSNPTIRAKFTSPAYNISIRYSISPVYNEVERDCMMKLFSNVNFGGVISNNSKSSPVIDERINKVLNNYSALDRLIDVSSNYCDTLSKTQNELEKARFDLNYYKVRSEEFASMLYRKGHIASTREVYYNDKNAVVRSSKNEWSLRGKLKINPLMIKTPTSPINLHGRDVRISDIPSTEYFLGTIAVQVHLYYEDLIPEFFNYLNNIPYPFDLYISCRKEANLKRIGNWFRKLRYVKDIIIRKTENRGRDVAPVYVLFAKELSEHDYFLHIHTKKSLYTGCEQSGWRRYCLDSILGSSDHIKKVFSLFKSNKNIGLVFPENPIDEYVKHWLDNIEIGESLLSNLGIKFVDGLFDYPVGSFYWVRTSAVKKLFDKHLTFNDFAEEQGQTDGTIAHAIERAITFISEDAGFHSAIIDRQDGVVRFDKSNKTLNYYFKTTKEDCYSKVSTFNNITFDIFDILVTRKVFRPTDIFKIVESRISKDLGINCSFYKARQTAEIEAKSVYGVKTTLDNIYEKLLILLDISESIANKIKKIEIDVELEYIIPRKDMLWLFNKLVESGKHIVLVEDSYFDSDVITRLLTKCGYSGWKELIVSSETGLCKVDGSMWDDFISKHDMLEWIHIGDIFYSNYLLRKNKYKLNVFSILSPTNAFSTIAGYSKIASNYKGDSITSALILGSMVNEHLCNDAFCFNSNGTLKGITDEITGKYVFGPILLSFMQHIASHTTDDEKLLFLAREGFLLEPMYKRYCKAMGIKSTDSTYFLTSRRAVSVPTIYSEEDIKGILSQHYVGSLANMLKSRLGYEGMLNMSVGNLMVNSPQDIDMIMDLIRPEMDVILENASRERDLYVNYSKSIIGKSKNVSVVDLGYSGTTQYYLAKLLHSNIGGHYVLLDSSNLKPVKLGCRVDSIFEYNDNDSDLTNRKCLFLEGILQAPYGQFICFKKDGDDIQEFYDKHKYYPDRLKVMQDSILEYIDETIDNLKSITESINIDYDLAKGIYLGLVEDINFCHSIKVLNVQDSYCSDGTQVFDGTNWVIKK